MLILKRKIGQAIEIGKEIKVVVKNVTPGNVTLGIEAPKTTKIKREELEDHDTE